MKINYGDARVEGPGTRFPHNHLIKFSYEMEELNNEKFRKD